MGPWFWQKSVRVGSRSGREHLCLDADFLSRLKCKDHRPPIFKAKNRGKSRINSIFPDFGGSNTTTILIFPIFLSESRGKIDWISIFPDLRLKSGKINAVHNFTQFYLISRFTRDGLCSVFSTKYQDPGAVHISILIFISGFGSVSPIYLAQCWLLVATIIFICLLVTFLSLNLCRDPGIC